MKRGWIILLAALFIALSAILWESRRVVYFLVRIAMEPTGWGCDEGPVTNRRSANLRGDVVEGFERACTGFGTIVDHSIVLELGGDNKPTTLVEHSDPQPNYPKFRWLNDDTLLIDLGKVTWVSSQVDKVGSIHITYVYTKGQTQR